MSTEQLQASRVELSIGLPQLGPAVLERLVSATAARADLPVDRVVDAMTLVDALGKGLADVLDARPWQLSIDFAPGEVSIRVADLAAGEAEAIRLAAALPGIGDVLAHTATTVDASSDCLSVVLS